MIEAQDFQPSLEDMLWESLDNIDPNIKIFLLQTRNDFDVTLIIRSLIVHFGSSKKEILRPIFFTNAPFVR